MSTNLQNTSGVTERKTYRGYEAVIGLEVHVQLKTNSKIFSPDHTNFDSGDNENISPVTLGMPGTLPVMNQRAIEFAVKTGLALGCQIRKKSVFARKNYFYPDSPKGYQISQYDKPICENGSLTIKVEGQTKKVTIIRAHLEEDAGKSTHFGNYTLVNYNRAGIPLLEIVTAPDLSSPAEAAEYARTLRQVVRYLDVCDGNLEEGSMRCDCNVSVRPIGVEKLGTRVELKNINSFRFVEKAIEYEIDRQIDEIEAGKKIVQETRLYDPDKNRTYTMRTKEDAEDYRYFPDPDLLPIVIEDSFIDSVQKILPELPSARAQRFVQQLKIAEADADLLLQEKEIADYFEATAAASHNPKASANWIMTEVLREMNQNKLGPKDIPVPSENLGELIRLVDEGKISGKMGKTVFQEMWSTGQKADVIIKEKNLVQVTDTSVLEKAIDDVMAGSPSQVAEYRSGKTKVFGFFVGQVMKATKGQASPDLVNEILKKKLEG